MYINKWIVLTAAAFTQLSAGLPYCFSIYSEALKDRFGYTQTQLQTVAFACSLGAYLGVISGLFYDHFRDYDKLGPRLTLLVGMSVNLIGFLGLWASGAGLLDPALWQVALFAWIAHNNGTWFDTSSMVTIVRNFPGHRGTVVGAMKSITGISGAVYVQVYLGFFSPDAISFILFLAVMPFAISCVTICFLNRVPFLTASEAGNATSKRLLFMYGIIILLALYVTFTALWQGISDEVPKKVRMWITYGVGALLLPLLALPCGTGGLRAVPIDEKGSRDEEASRSDRSIRSVGFNVSPAPGGNENAPLLTIKPPADDEREELEDLYSPIDNARSMVRSASRASMRSSRAGSLAGSRANSRASSGPPTPNLYGTAASAQEQQQQRQHQEEIQQVLLEEVAEEEVVAVEDDPDLPEYTLVGAVLTAEFWLLGLSSAVGMGCGLVLNNNLAQVVQALGGARDGQGVHVSLFAVANCFGRLLAGYIPQQAFNSRGVSRPWFLALLGVMTCLSALFNAYADIDNLIYATILTGISFGCHWTLLATLSSEVFGLKYFATIYKLLSLAPSIGGYLLATVLAGSVYDNHTTSTSSGNSAKCHGPECFRNTFLICSGLALIEAVAGVVLVFRTRRIYQAMTRQLKAAEAAAAQ